MVENVSTNNSTLVTLRPNRSATWVQSKLFLLFMCFPIFIVAIGWTLVGAWPVLPFAGFDFLLLAYVTYRVCYRSYQKDWIKIEKYKITVHCGVGDKTSEQTLLRSDTQLYVTKPTKPMERVTLRLADNSHTVDIGEFLNKEDRELCRTALVGAGVIECVDRWAK
ncbi:MAG: DUF2244 domain-containing protein [Algicola sp.]|nr:DUF2244 domain-containing protein [Algicola sp.]